MCDKGGTVEVTASVGGFLYFLGAGIVASSFHDGCSRPKIKAKRRTKPKTEDLHIAVLK